MGKYISFDSDAIRSSGMESLSKSNKAYKQAPFFPRGCESQVLISCSRKSSSILVLSSLFAEGLSQLKVIAEMRRRRAAGHAWRVVFI